MTSKPVRVRFPPSPTGYLHAGNVRTAIFNWLYARHSGGQFILRIEDTDRTRFVPDALSDIVEHLRWLGIDWDEGPDVGGPHEPYTQSERIGIYQEYAQKLIGHGHAYRCYCTPERLAALREEQRARKENPGYDRHCRYLTQPERAEQEASGRQSVVRLAMPLEGKTTFHDTVRGDITFENVTMDDFVLLKSDGFPTYHLAVVVDDHLMSITHILRGDEWLPSVPKHILLYKVFGWEPPVLVHLPLILDPSGKGKMSKRRKREDDGRAFFIHEFRRAGYLPEALFNYLNLLGWSYDGETQVFSREQAVTLFDVDDLIPKPSAFDYDKLEWMNGMYIRQLAADELTERLVPFVAEGLGMDEADVRSRPELRALVPHIQERLTTLADASEMVDFAFADAVNYEVDLLLGQKMSWQETQVALQRTVDTLSVLPQWDEAAVEGSLRDLTQTLNLKPRQLFGIIRIATTGKKVAPPIFGTLAALGRERSLARLQSAFVKAKAQVDSSNES